MKRLLRILRRVVFIGVLAACIACLSSVLIPKNGAHHDWPNTATFRDFYKLEPNSLDVLFLGSSHGVRAFAAQETYNNYGLTSYNLSSQEQSVAISYYWLEEALRTQKPSVVVLDTYFLFPYRKDLKLNMKEGMIRTAMDPMKLSPVKLRAIWEICQLDPEQEVINYLLPFVRYHDRWQELTLDSFIPDEEPGLMGYSPLFKEAGANRYEPFGAVDGEMLDMQPTMLSYLDRMRELCEQNGARLLLVKTPAVGWLIMGKHNAVKAYAEEHGLDFIDFNEYDTYYDGLDFWFDTDNADMEHASHDGAVKLTNYIAEFIVNEYEVEGREHPHWDEANELYEAWIEEGYESMY